MLSIKEGFTYKFVGSNAMRDGYEADHVPMYDVDPLEGSAEVVFDGQEWLVPKISVEPEGA